MALRTQRSRHTLVFLAVGIAVALSASSGWAAITAGHIDDFQDGTTQHWRVGGAGFSIPNNMADAGPLGIGDHALYSRSGSFGFPGRLVVLNEPSAQFPGPGNWVGDWTAAGITQVALDVRNPGTMADADNLTIRLGIAGPGGAGAFGDVYVTGGIAVPPDNTWYSLVFDVLPSDFSAVGLGSDIEAALADATQFRIFHSRLDQFTGEDATIEFYLDNIHALGAALPLSGDYNGNGTVDAADYVVWRKSNGQSGTGLAADGTGPGGVPDGVVDNLDYEFWRGQFGNSQSGGGHQHGLGASVATVPEPATALLLCGAGMLVLAAAFRRIDRGKEPAN